MITKLTGNTQVLTVSTSSTATQPITDGYTVRIATTGAIFVNLGNVGTVASSANCAMMPSNTVETIRVTSTRNILAFSAVTGSSTVSVTTVDSNQNDNPYIN